MQSVRRDEPQLDEAPVDNDLVNHPGHYTVGEIEVIEAIDAWGFGVGFCAGNVIKYVARHEHKGSATQDLEKARWYLNHLIELRSQQCE